MEHDKDGGQSRRADTFPETFQVCRGLVVQQIAQGVAMLETLRATVPEGHELLHVNHALKLLRDLRALVEGMPTPALRQPISVEEAIALNLPI